MAHTPVGHDDVIVGFYPFVVDRKNEKAGLIARPFRIRFRSDQTE